MKKLFWGIISATAVFGIFVSGQMFSLFPDPNKVFWGTIILLAVALVGYLFGTFHNNNKEKDKKSKEKIVINPDQNIK